MCIEIPVLINIKVSDYFHNQDIIALKENK